MPVASVLYAFTVQMYEDFYTAGSDDNVKTVLMTGTGKYHKNSVPYHQIKSDHAPCASTVILVQVLMLQKTNFSVGT